MPKTFYNFSRILGHNAVLNFVPGNRGSGKTYGAKKIAINDGIKNGSQFIYMRRYVEELDEARTLFFDDIAHLWPKLEFQTTRKFAQCRPRLVKEVGESEKEFKERLKANEWITIGYFIAMSTTSRYKSTPFPRVKWIIVDEFILEKGNTIYLKNEATVLVNFLNTVDRSSDRVRVLLLANAVSINNPYFLKWKIRPTPNKITLYEDGFIAADFPENKAFQTEVYATRFGRFIEGTEYADYAVGNIFKDNGENLIAVKDSRAEYAFTLETKTATVSVWILRRPGEPTGYFMQSRQPAVQKIFTTDPDKMDTNRVFMADNDKILQILRGAYRQALCWFDTPETRNAFIEIFIR